MSRRRHPAPSSTTAAAMSLAQLERWLQDRTERRPIATSMPVLDGYIAAIVAGPVSISPLDWICPLLAIDADAFNHGGTAEFAAISAVAQGRSHLDALMGLWGEETKWTIAPHLPDVPADAVDVENIEGRAVAASRRSRRWRRKAIGDCL